MKLKYFIPSLFAALAMLVGCSDDNTIGTLGNITVDKSYVSIPVEGGDVVVTVNATGDWAMLKSVVIDTKTKEKAEMPKWLTASTLSGSAGTTELKFHADKSDAGREAVVQLAIGDKVQFVTVRQGSMTAQTATCAEALAGSDGKVYRVKGAVQNIQNTTYGNYDIVDVTGKIYVYGTLDKDGKEKNFSSLGIEAGDVVEVEGPRSTYNGNGQLVNVTVLSIQKSLLKIAAVDSVDHKAAVIAKEGGQFKVKVAYKGSGAYVTIPEADREWLEVSYKQYIAGIPTKIVPNPADTVVYTFTAKANAGQARSSIVEFVSSNGNSSTTLTQKILQDGGIAEVTAAEFNSKTDGDALYKISGVVTKIANNQYGNLYIKDATGEIYIYGVLDAEGKAKNFASTGIKVGDIVTLITVKTSYKGTPQGKEAKVDNRIDVKTVTTAEFLAAPVSSDVYYRVTGVVGEYAGQKYDIVTYGNIGLTDEAGSIYVYGVSTGWKGETKKFSTLGIAAGDKITVIGTRSVYKDKPQMAGAFFVEKITE